MRLSNYKSDVLIEFVTRIDVTMGAERAAIKKLVAKNGWKVFLQIRLGTKLKKLERARPTRRLPKTTGLLWRGGGVRLSISLRSDKEGFEMLNSDKLMSDKLISDKAILSVLRSFKFTDGLSWERKYKENVFAWKTLKTFIV